jgi:CTP:molybdopterin cytidylyltransferase MocA
LLFLIIDYFRTTSEINNLPCVPAIFDIAYFEKLSQLNQDKGAKDILLAAQNEVYVVCPDANLMDVDTQMAYEKVYNSLGKE